MVRKLMLQDDEDHANQTLCKQDREVWFDTYLRYCGIEFVKKGNVASICAKTREGLD
ncbi:hypothetical protein KDI_53910 [Dictyobacter arantiisoli]|uniref:Uncharacterized protein n=1 Tax=Dictyobacter arantiisoli TaxID=2014874 RepID=A0A5A5TK58_9CHLR|nr:hypothetical protein KDI_53910 [Dictyobacter arantiisoli]